MIRFLVMDVDGTLTDGKIYMGQDGELFKAFDIKDGYGVKCLLPEANIIPVVITARNSKIVENRCREMGVTELYQDRMNKLETLQQVLRTYSELDHTEYSMANVAYVGDDLLDLQCMIPIKQARGIVACPNDAVEAVKAISDYISTKNAGNGAVREIIDEIAHEKHISHL
ncbi:MAG: 3-deoxy-D-manno-octulosonate 8-phosphate phosphatase [Paludibacteraceae bacterium]|nr:3-deoxy-D-manno-octulosonate 8-phosphate phosphatase [Paludibacteraceae bacterium]